MYLAMGRQILGFCLFFLVTGVSQASIERSGRAIGTEVLPEGCGNPFADAGSFINFYEAALASLAARMGADTSNVADLFAVNELRAELNTLIPNPSEESAIDRLIMAQLCRYQKIHTQTSLREGRTNARRLEILSTGERLHEHLLAIAPQMYRDARSYVVTVLAERARAKQSDEEMERRWSEVEKARRRARMKIRDLFE